MADAASPEEVEAELEGTRIRLGWLLTELTRRRHEFAHVGRQLRLQLQRHRGPVLGGLASVLALTAGGVALAVRRSRARRRLPERARRLRLAMARMIAHPDRVAGGEPALAQKVLRAALTSAAAVVAKRLASTAFDRVQPRLRSSMH